MITCPRCSATLPPATKQCQFCQTDVSKVPRPLSEEAKSVRGYVAPSWVWTWYTIVSVYWVADGAWQVFSGAGAFTKSTSVVNLVIGSALIVVGLGLLFKVRILRGVAHILCWVSLIGGGLDIIAGLFATIAIGPIAYVFALLGLIRAGTAAFMIYLIGETESLYPM